MKSFDYTIIVILICILIALFIIFYLNRRMPYPQTRLITMEQTISTPNMPQLSPSLSVPFTSTLPFIIILFF
jgi:hypothetical protein